VFFAYIGFDVVATTAEETKNPQRDMPIAVGSIPARNCRSGWVSPVVLSCGAGSGMNGE
jgi:L-asparagine transporter-like permease